MLEARIRALLSKTELNSGKILWIIDEADGLPGQLVQQYASRSCILSNRIDIVEHYQSLKIDTILSDFELSTSSTFAAIVFALSKEKLLCQHISHRSVDWLDEQGQFIVFGKKNLGIKAYFDKLASGERLKKIGDTYLGVASKSHLQSARSTFENAYQQNTIIAELPRRHHTTQTSYIDPAYTLKSKPGIFSWKKLDQGSEFLTGCLLENKVIFENKAVFDLACGCGHLALFAASLGARTIFASDNNITAVDTCKQNLIDNQIPGDVSCDDAGSHIQARFDTVLCNPPFHKGKQADFSLSLKFVEAARKRLNPGGEAWFVCNAFIPIENLAKPLFNKVEQVANNKQFKVLHLQKPVY